MNGSTRPGDSREFSNVDSSLIRDPKIKALQTSGFINHGSALGRFMEVSIRLWPRALNRKQRRLVLFGPPCFHGFWVWALQK